MLRFVIILPFFAMSYKFKVRPSGLPVYRYQDSGAKIQI